VDQKILTQLEFDAWDTSRLNCNKLSKQSAEATRIRLRDEEQALLKPLLAKLDSPDPAVQAARGARIEETGEATHEKVAAMELKINDLHKLLIAGETVGDVKGQKLVQQIRTRKAVLTTQREIAIKDAKHERDEELERHTRLVEEMSDRKDLTVQEILASPDLVDALKALKIKSAVAGMPTTRKASNAGAAAQKEAATEEEKAAAEEEKAAAAEEKAAKKAEADKKKADKKAAADKKKADKVTAKGKGKDKGKAVADEPVDEAADEGAQNAAAAPAAGAAVDSDAD
jgi:colicin import membrane protein